MAVTEIRERYLELANSLFSLIAPQKIQRLSAQISLACISEVELRNPSLSTQCHRRRNNKRLHSYFPLWLAERCDRLLQLD